MAKTYKQLYNAKAKEHGRAVMMTQIQDCQATIDTLLHTLGSDQRLQDEVERLSAMVNALVKHTYASSDRVNIGLQRNALEAHGRPYMDKLLRDKLIAREDLDMGVAQQKARKAQNLRDIDAIRTVLLDADQAAYNRKVSQLRELGCPESEWGALPVHVNSDMGRVDALLAKYSPKEVK